MTSQALLRPAPSATPRRARKSQALIAVASDILNRKGVRGMTLPEVAAALGVTTPSIAYYFSRKDDLALACMLDAVERFDASIATAAAEPTPALRVYRLLDLHTELLFAVAAGEAAPLAAFTDLRAMAKPQGEAVRDALNAMFRRLRALLDPPAAGGRRALNARAKLLLEQLLWLTAWTRRYDAVDRPRLTTRMTDILEHGIALPGAAWAPLPLEGVGAGPEPGPDGALESFLQAATRLINQHGYKGASVEKISASRNVTKGSFYHHYQTKDDLVTACIEHSHEVMQRAQLAALAKASNQYQALSSAVAALVAYQLSDAGPLLRTSARAAIPDEMRPAMAVKADRITLRFANMVSDGVAEGSIRPVDPILAGQAIHAAINSAVDVGQLAPGMTPAEAVELYARPVLTGVLKP
jgi:AcrR family transcriptional regulator